MTDKDKIAEYSEALHYMLDNFEWYRQHEPETVERLMNAVAGSLWGREQRERVHRDYIVIELRESGETYGSHYKGVVTRTVWVRRQIHELLQQNGLDRSAATVIVKDSGEHKGTWASLNRVMTQLLGRDVT